jgi:Tfp pilus assembly protein PilF
MSLDEIESQEIINQAHEYLNQKNTIRALSVINDLLDKDPSNHQGWLYLGIIKRRLGKLEDAIKCFETAVDIEPSMIEAWGLLTITYMDNNEYILAEKIMEKAAKLNPIDEKINFYKNNLIRVYEKFGPFF